MVVVTTGARTVLKKPGHQDSTTFKDGKGESNKDCLPNQEWESGDTCGNGMTLNTVDKINNTLLIKKQITPVASNVELVINNSTIKHNYILAKLDSNVTKYFF